jgi:hypothetical protein
MNARWYENAFDVVLSFGAEKRLKLPPGLYLPGVSFIVAMRESEILSKVNTDAITVDDDVIGAFEKRMKARMGTRVPKYVSEQFSEHILSDTYSPNRYDDYAVSVVQFDHRLLGDIYASKRSSE